MVSHHLLSINFRNVAALNKIKLREGLSPLPSKYRYQASSRNSIALNQLINPCHYKMNGRIQFIPLIQSFGIMKNYQLRLIQSFGIIKKYQLRLIQSFGIMKKYQLPLIQSFGIMKKYLLRLIQSFGIMKNYQLRLIQSFGIMKNYQLRLILVLGNRKIHFTGINHLPVIYRKQMVQCVADFAIALNQMVQKYNVFGNESNHMVQKYKVFSNESNQMVQKNKVFIVLLNHLVQKHKEFGNASNQMVQKHYKFGNDLNQMVYIEDELNAERNTLSSMTVGLYISLISLHYKDCEVLSFRRRRNLIEIWIGFLLRRNDKLQFCVHNTRNTLFFNNPRH